jgi:NAD(P)-dependent dehydrogenase (short-subunit alcohol dehydrogenase family)
VGEAIDPKRSPIGSGARDGWAHRGLVEDLFGEHSSNIGVEPLELADRHSVQAFVKRWKGPLNILINDAGVMAEPLKRTEEGWEHQFATNYLGHFGLAVGLHDALAAGAPARIVALTSSGHFFSPVVFDDLQFDRTPYDPWLAYRQSKTASVLFAVDATRRWGPEGMPTP